MKKYLPILFILVTVLTPFLFITTGMRIALSPLFFNLEYRLPNFPADIYGFTQQERLLWADFSIDYIAGRISDETFAAATFPDGLPLFNEREISHMVDVRDLTVVMLWFWRFLTILFITTIIISYRGKTIPSFIQAIEKGAKITLGLILGVLLFLMINFNQLFTLFHRIFFEGDTWLFYMSDTLIRLFPLKFWQDLFIFIGGFALVFSLTILLINRQIKKNTA